VKQEERAVSDTQKNRALNVVWHGTAGPRPTLPVALKARILRDRALSNLLK